MTTPRHIPKHSDSNGWWETLPKVPAPRVLSGQLRVQTAIIGGGICGVSTANRLAQLRPSDEVCLIEAERIGNGASGRNAGLLSNMHSHGPPKHLDILRRNMQLWESGLADLRDLVAKHKIACDWDDSGRFYGSAGPDGEKHIDELAQTLDQLGHEYRWLTRDEMNQRIGTRFYIRGLHATGNAVVNPAALMRGFAQNLPTNVTVFEDSPVIEFHRENGGFVIQTKSGMVQAERLVLAAGVFLKQFGVASGRYVPMATFASVTAPLSDHEMASMGSGTPYCLLGGSEYGATIRLTRDKRLFVRNYYKFEPGGPTSAEKVARISQMHRRSMRSRWPDLGDTAFEHSWGGIMAFTQNNGSIFGEVAPGLFAILTNDVSPMTRGAASGRLLADLMEGQDSDHLSLLLGFPNASLLPPRPFLDVGIAIQRKLLHLAARKEF